MPPCYALNPAIVPQLQPAAPPPPPHTHTSTAGCLRNMLLVHESHNFQSPVLLLQIPLHLLQQKPSTPAGCQTLNTDILAHPARSGNSWQHIAHETHVQHMDQKPRNHGNHVLQSHIQTAATSNRRNIPMTPPLAGRCLHACMQTQSAAYDCSFTLSQQSTLQ
jgi:hypothetical protein